MSKVVKRGIVTPDKHFPCHDERAISCLVKSIEIIKPDFYIDLGDIGEFGSVSHWQWRKKKRPPLEYQMPFVDKDIEEINEGMDVIDEALDKTGTKEKYFIQGNHDEWLDRFLEENPYLPSSYKFENAMKLKERGYKFKKIGDFLKIGKLYFYHGHLHGGMHHTRNHLLKTGVNVMYGHWHDMQMYSITHMDGVKAAWSIGCLKDTSKDKNLWLGGRLTNWAHAFAVVDFFDKGLFTVHIQQIINGKTSLWGELIEG